MDQSQVFSYYKEKYDIVSNHDRGSGSNGQLIFAIRKSCNEGTPYSIVKNRYVSLKFGFSTITNIMFISWCLPLLSLI